MNITENLSVRELVASYPHTRAVFDRYGMKGCGGVGGPAESIGFFARVHELEIDALLQEIREAVERPALPFAAAAASAADSIYRRFFKAGIVTTLTAGALWGALLLITIGLKSRFTAVSVFEINAHGHAQIFGWVGLFVMGFVLQAVPRFKQTALWRPRLAELSFYLMIGGIALRVIGETLSAHRAMLALGLFGSALELSAIILFLILLARTFQSATKAPAHYDYYIGVAFAWFLLQAILDMSHLYLTATAATRAALLHQIATWQAPLRDIQIHGFALTLILGVSQRLLSGVYGLPAVSARRSLSALALLTAGVLGESIFFIMFRETGRHLYAGLMYLGMMLIAAAVVIATYGWCRHLWGRPAHLPAYIVEDRRDRSFKFIRAAYGWLYLSMAMLLFIPFYNRIIGQPFSHAFYGATRHAITVGFISLMIMGVAAKIVPVLNGLDAHKISPLRLAFYLVNIGCAWRVIAQITTDTVPGAFAVIGVSGVLEVTALTIWGVVLWREMGRPHQRSLRVISNNCAHA